MCAYISNAQNPSTPPPTTGTSTNTPAPAAQPAPDSTTASTSVPVVPPATPDAATPSIAAPAPEPINPGFSGSPSDPSKPVVVHIVSPKPEEVLPNSTADIFFTVDNYALAEGGNRLHVIVNNNDPIPLSDLRQPLTVKELPEGGHTIRVYAVQPDGHSLPNPESFASVHFYIRKKNFQNYIAPNTPSLTVNLPISGIVDIEEGGRVWFDFRVSNAQLSSKGYKVHYKINDIEGNIVENMPVFWNGMKPGRYELTAHLLDANNTPVPGIFNQVHRAFDVRNALKALPSPDESVPSTNSNATGPRAMPED